jgi:hypothetical protein
MDYASPDAWAQIESLYDWTCCLYSTHKHTPNHRACVLSSHWPATSARMSTLPWVGCWPKRSASTCSMTRTYEPSRLKYWPSTSSAVNSSFQEKDGALLDPDLYLSRYADGGHIHEAHLETAVRSNPAHATAAAGYRSKKRSSWCDLPRLLCRRRYFGVSCHMSMNLRRWTPVRLYPVRIFQCGLVVYDGKFAFLITPRTRSAGNCSMPSTWSGFHQFGDLDEMASFKP